MTTLRDLAKKVRNLFATTTAGQNLQGWRQVVTNPQLRQEYNQYVIRPTIQRAVKPIAQPVRQGVSNLKTNVSLLAKPETADVWSAGFNASTIPGFLGQYLTNRYLKPVIQLPTNVKKTVSPQSSLGERLSGGLGIMSGIATLFPDPIQDVAMPIADLLKGTSAYRIENKGKKVGMLEPIKKGGLPALSGERYVGLGEALTSKPIGQAVGNIAELPLVMLTSKSLGKKASKETDELVRNVSRAVKEGNITLEEGMAIMGKMGELPKVKVSKIPKELEPLAQKVQNLKSLRYMNPGDSKIASALRKAEEAYSQALKGIEQAPKVKIKAPETISPSKLGYKAEVPRKTILKVSPEGKLQLPKEGLAKAGVRMEGQPPIPEVPGGIGKGVSKAGVGGLPPSGEIISDQDLISQLTKAIKEAKPIRGLQEELYTKARGEKLAKMMAAREKMAGEKGFYEELGALKGELPKAQFEPIRQQFTQENVDRLFNMIKKSPKVDEWGKINTQVGLAKILGEKGGGVPTKTELENLYKVFGKDFTEAILSKRPLFQKLTEAGMQLYNLPRSMMTGVADLSATLMQNIMYAYRHPILTAKNFVNEVKMFASEPFYRASMEEISQRPTYDIMKNKAKISFTEVGPIVSQREEAFMASWAEKIPGLGKVVKMTGRAFTGFINKMRADVFDQLYNSAKLAGENVDNPKLLKDLGKMINAGTGRGDLGAFARAAPILNQGLFSAKKLAAAFYWINPVNYITAHPLVRKEMLKTVAAYIGAGLTILGLAKLAGAEVGDDDTSSDFGKIKIGNTRFNIWGTNQQLVVLVSRMFKGYATSSTTGKKMYLGEGYKPLTRLELVGRFFETKTHPTLSFLTGLASGQNQIGEEFRFGPELLNRFIPMVFSDAYDLYQEHGPIGLLGIIPAALGIPVQTYGEKYPTLEQTATGKATVKFNPIPGLGEDIWNKITGQPPSTIPKEEWRPLWQAELERIRKEADIGELKRTGKELIEGKVKPAVLGDKEISGLLAYYGFYDLLKKEPTTSIEQKLLTDKIYKKALDVLDSEEIDDATKTRIFEGIGLKEEDVIYDYFTRLADDLQQEAVLSLIGDKTGQERLNALIELRRPSEGSRKLLLTDTIINKMVKQGILTSGEGELLKSYEWDEKTGKFIRSPQKGKKPTKITVKATTIPKITFKALPRATIPALKLSPPPKFKVSRRQPIKITVPTTLPTIKMPSASSYRLTIRR